MKSRVHPKYKTKYHVRNWASYERALIQRGDLTVWLSPDAVAAWEPATGGRRGGQRKYSDIAIETALTVRLIFHLPLRQAEGFLTSVFGLMRLDLRVPDHTTLSRRGQHLDVALCHAPREKRLHLLIDSTGLSIVGEGEWAAAKHGGHGKRGWSRVPRSPRSRTKKRIRDIPGYAGICRDMPGYSGMRPRRLRPMIVGVPLEPGVGGAAS